MSYTPQAISSLIHGLLHRKRATSSPTEYRLLQPIASSIGVESYKNALTAADQLLKRQPNNYLIIALKVTALSLSTRPPSAKALKDISAYTQLIQDPIHKAALADADVLLFFSVVLTGLGRDDDVLSIMSKATAAHPEDEDVCAEAFNHYIRTDHLALAQQVSLKMHKTLKDDKFMWWSLQTVVLLVADPKTDNADLLLSIAERQLSAHYVAKYAEARATADDAAAGAIEFGNTNEFHLATRVVELRAARERTKAAGADASAQAGALAAAAVVLPSLPPRAAGAAPLSAQETLLAHFASGEGQKWCERGLGPEIWRRETELRYGTVEGGEWVKSWERLKAGLEKGDTNWHTMLYLIRCAFASAAGSSAAYDATAVGALPPPSEAGLGLLARTRAFFRELASSAAGGKERGFLLGTLEIAREARARGWDQVEKLGSLVEEYFEQFGTKMCCFDDLHPYLEVLTEEERTTLRETMDDVANGVMDGTLKTAQRVINASKMARFLAPTSDTASESSAAVTYLARYFEALPIGKGSPATELQPADDFALLACQALVAAWGYSKDRAHLERAVAILEFALKRSKHKYQLRILLVNLLRLLGAPSLAVAHYRTLGVKQIQYDTLSHLVTTRASTFAGVVSDGGVWEEVAGTEGWYPGGEREANEMRVRVYQGGNWEKVEDFSQFRGRLAGSLSKQLVKIEALRMRAVKGLLDQSAADQAEDEIEAVLSKPDLTLSDNRDLATLPNLQPSSAPSIWAQTRLGPPTSEPWLRALAQTYSHLVVDGSEVVDVEAVGETAELTGAERALLEFSRKAREALAVGEDGAEEKRREEEALRFFKEREGDFGEVAGEEGRLPWEVLHVAEIALEGYCLLDIAVENRLDELAATRPKEYAKQIKRLKTFRASAAQLLRAVGTKATAHGKQVAKARPKVLASLAELRQFELLDEDTLLGTAAGLVEARRQMAEGLGAAIHKRTAK